jgi:5'-AMP-activated protein kinase, regulatory gamma subunit
MLCFDRLTRLNSLPYTCNNTDVPNKDMLSAPLWDSVKCQFTGLFTVTDFIDLLLYYKMIGKDVTTLAVDSIADIIHFLKQSHPIHSPPPAARTAGTTATPESTDRAGTNSPIIAPHQPMSLLRSFQGAGTSCTLYRACTQMLTAQQDFLPIVFTADMRVLSCITYTNILEHLVTHFREQRRLFDDSVADLNIGTYGSAVIKVTSQQTLSEALQLMSLHQLAALPIIDATTHKILAMYSRSDITFLTRAIDAEDAVRNLSLPLYEIINASTTAAQQQVTTPDALRTCSPTHTLQAIFESFAIQRFNRLCVVDSDERLLGIVSAKDLVAYFLSDAIPVTERKAVTTIVPTGNTNQQ